jgi:hypothetical protein
VHVESDMVPSGDETLALVAAVFAVFELRAEAGRASETR